MRAPFRHPTRTVTENVHGVDVAYDIPDTTPIIRLPFNLDAALRRILFAFAVAMTTGAIIWGTVAIGGMLRTLAPSWAAYLVAGVFDAGWAACLIAEWILRHDSTRARVPARAGITMLAVSMSAIIIDGHRNHALLVGIIGALVSAAAKGVWAIGMHTIRIRLDPKYEAYLRALQQQTGTEQALALGERDRMLTHDRTVRLKLALEAQHGSPQTSVDQLAADTRTSPVHAPDQPVNHIESTPEPVPVHAAAATVDRPVRPEDQVDELFRRLRGGDRISKQDAADILGIPPSTAYRRLKDAESKLHQYR